jgi:hypothetical protein
LEVLFREGGVEALSDPDASPVLSGGLALRRPDSGEVLVEPGCCSDLGDLADWRAAARHREAEWRMVWIGHPWVSVRYRQPWLVLSQAHESAEPEERWAFRPDHLERALAVAAAELESFAGRLAAVLPLLGYPGEPLSLARRLAGLQG